jgi:glycosyltransferase involved in cell wall biosynthesis
MANQTIKIINSVDKQKDKYNILTFDTHERYQSQLSKTGHNFFSFRYENCKVWDQSYADFPENYYTLPKNSLISGLDIDFILSQSKFGQFQVASQIQQVLGVPILSLEHTLPIPSWPKEQLDLLKSMVGQENVFISEYSVDKWGMSCSPTVIHHSVDTEKFSPKETEKTTDVLSVVNEFINRDYCCNYNGWQRIVAKLQNAVIDVVGKDSEQIPNVVGGTAKDISDLVSRYNGCKVFLNTSTISPVPTSLLEAMACGCAVVTTATCMIPEIIEQGQNGFMSNDENELAEYVQRLLDDPNLAKEMGDSARQTILEKFSEEKFINNWNTTFDKVYGV